MPIMLNIVISYHGGRFNEIVDRVSSFTANRKTPLFSFRFGYFNFTIHLIKTVLASPNRNTHSKVCFTGTLIKVPVPCSSVDLKYKRNDY